MKLFSKISVSLILLAFLGFLPMFAQAQFTSDLSNNFSGNLQQAANKASYPSTQASENYINTRLGLFITLAFIGTIFLILIIYSGIQWMTAGGNEEKVEKSKKRIINAVIGLIVILSAYIITTFVYNYFDAKFLTVPQGSQIPQTGGPGPQNDADCVNLFHDNLPRFLVETGECVQCLTDDDCNGFWNLNICNENHGCDRRF